MISHCPVAPPPPRHPHPTSALPLSSAQISHTHTSSLSTEPGLWGNHASENHYTDSVVTAGSSSGKSDSGPSAH